MEHRPPPQVVLRDLSLASRLAHAIGVAAELGVADHLAAGPLTVDELAIRVEAHAPSLRRLLRFLASYKVFGRGRDDRFGLTPLSELLRTNVPGSLRTATIFNHTDAISCAWNDMIHSIRTGETAFQKVHGSGFFPFLEQHPYEKGLFDEMIAGLTVPVARAVATAWDFSNTREIVDVGGGLGTLAIAVLQEYQHIVGTTFDQSSTIDRAREAIDLANLSDRLRAAGGDFFETVPPGADTYLLKFILHDWDDETCLTILRNCRRAIRADGRLLIIEAPIMDEDDQPSFAKSEDLNMLVLLGGQERTLAEYGGLLSASGFELGRIKSVMGELHVIEALPSGATDV